ncbi:MAG: methionyl-tRNA formyltransferase [Proteobacteria bacterium]|nr:methionyl-tRNA formyltransferase [Pseudomonadota bacterium]
MRVIFMGSPAFAVPALAALIADGHEIAGVYAQPPRPAGRGQRERRSPVHEYAAAQGIAVRTPTSLKDREIQREFAGLSADIAVVAAYGLILPPPVLAAPRLGCINIHASLLPRWRGAAPIQRAILTGDAETGITLMQMDEGLDTGAILLQERLPIPSDATAASLTAALATQGARLIAHGLRELAAGRLTARPQPATGVTYAAKLTREEGRLDWHRPAAELERQVRAFDPWPGAWFEVRGERIKVVTAKLAAAPAGTKPGTVCDNALRIACGAGALLPTRIQRPGKAPMDAAAALRGFSIPAGARLD